MAPRILLGPSSIDGGVSRLVARDNGTVAVETWTPAGWRPGGAGVDEVLKAPPASRSKLDRLRIPEADRARGEWG